MLMNSRAWKNQSHAKKLKMHFSILAVSYQAIVPHNCKKDVTIVIAWLMWFEHTCIFFCMSVFASPRECLFLSPSSWMPPVESLLSDASICVPPFACVFLSTLLHFILLSVLTFWKQLWVLIRVLCRLPVY